MKKMISAILICILILSLAACGQSSPAPAANPAPADTATPAAPAESNTEAPVEAEFVLKAGHTVAQEHPYQYGLEYMNDLLVERTNGKVRLEIYPSAQLGGERELFEGAQLGTVDLALGATAPLANFDQSFLVFDLPYLFESREHAYACLDGDFGQSKFALLEDKGMIGLSYWEAGFFPISTSKGIMEKPEDAAGLNIRVMENEIFMAWITAMGSNPVPMAFSEVFTAVQNGTVDGASVSISSTYSSKLHTVAPYVSCVDAIYSPLPLVCSKKTWDKLPEEYQKILKECAVEAGQYEREYLTNAEADYIEKMIEDGATVRIYTLEEKKVWEDAFKDAIWSKYVGDRVLQSDVDAIAALRSK